MGKAKLSIKNYALFILTHGRPNQQVTVKTLKKVGYTGKIYFVCDVDDASLPEYKKLYGKSVKTFDKKKYRGRFDLMTNAPIYNAVVYARNAVYDIAERLGLDFIVVMDDDYSTFKTSADKNGFYKRNLITNMDKIFSYHLKFLNESNLSVLAFAQGGDFVGGWNSNIVGSGFSPLRKAMNTFFLRVSDRVEFKGLINEDSVMGVDLARQGKVVLTNTLIQLEQTTTQKAAGGLTDIYKDLGTYQKSFFTVIASPSSTVVSYVPAVGRVHHRINGLYAYPRIVSEKHKK